jgi:hypothetical protein
MITDAIRAERAREAELAWAEYLAAQKATAEKTERLRKLRLQRDAKMNVAPSKISGRIKQFVAEVIGDGALAEEGAREANMARGTKPSPKSKAKVTSQDGAHKGGGVNTLRHAGPGRVSKTRATGTKGRQLQKRGNV